MQGKISSRRDNWGAEYSGDGKERGKGLGGGKKVPTFTDQGLPHTYTSSHKVMATELDALKRGATLKRKAEDEAGRNACIPVKKPRLGSMGTTLKKMKEEVEKKRQTTDKEKERYAGGKPELRDAMQVVDTLMRSATETENQNAVLEAMLLKNEAQHIKNTDDMFDEWLAYNEVKRGEVDRMLGDHATEIKTRDTKIGALEAEAKRVQARLEKEKRKVKVSDARLAKVKRSWMQEQDFMEKKFREIEENAVDLDEWSELNYGSDDSGGEESGSDGEPEEVDEEAHKVEGKVKKGEEEQKELKEADEEEKQLRKEEKKENVKKDPHEPQEAKVDKQPKQTESTARELRKSITREQLKNTDAKDVVNLDGDEDEDEGEEDEGPISSHKKGRSRVIFRSRPAQSA